MNAGEVVEGVGLCARGLVVYGLMRWQVATTAGYGGWPRAGGGWWQPYPSPSAA